MPTAEHPSAWSRFLDTFTCGLTKRKSRSKEQKTAKTEQGPKLKRTKNPKVKGNVHFEKSEKESQMWDEVVKNSLCGTQIVIKGVVANTDSRKIYAYAPSDFTPSMEQFQSVMELMDAHTQGRDVSNEPFAVAEDDFEVVTFSEHGFLIAKTSRTNKGHGGKDGAEQPTRNLVGFKTNYIVMLGVCAQNKLDDALGLFKAMHENALKM